MPIDDPIEFLFSLERLGMKFGLENISALCRSLGHPERTFRPVLIALYQWGEGFFPPEEPNVRLVVNETGKDADPVLVDRVTGHPLDEEHTEFVPGATATAQLREVLARRRSRGVTGQAS